MKIISDSYDIYGVNYYVVIDVGGGGGVLGLNYCNELEYFKKECRKFSMSEDVVKRFLFNDVEYIITKSATARESDDGSEDIHGFKLRMQKQ